MSGSEFLERLLYRREAEALASFSLYMAGLADTMGEDASTLFLKRDRLKNAVGMAGIWTIYYFFVKQMSEEEIRRELFGRYRSSLGIVFPVQAVIVNALKRARSLLGEEGRDVREA
jgi:hypothetical protein